MDGGAWRAAVHGVAKSQTWLSDFTFAFHLHALEKEMATRSSVLAWRIPGTGEPGGLPSMGSHRVGHDWCDLAAAAAVYLCWVAGSEPLLDTYALIALLCDSPVTRGILLFSHREIGPVHLSPPSKHAHTNTPEWVSDHSELTVTFNIKAWSWFSNLLFWVFWLVSGWCFLHKA